MFDQLFAQLTQTLTQLIGQGLGFVFQVIWIIASLMWTLLDRVLAFVGAQIELLTHALSTSVFAPLIGQVSGSLSGAVNMAWVIALLVLAICYMLAAFGPIRVVTLRSVLSWYVVALVFFQVGPTLYTTMDNFRGSIQGTFYSTTLTYFQGSNIGSLNVQNTSTGVAALDLTPLCDNFGPFTGNTAGYVNGIDVALGFLRADGLDVIGHLPTFGNVMCATSSPLPALASLPRSWYNANSFFDAAHIPGLTTSDFFTMTNDQQMQVVVNALSGLLRLGAGITLLVFGVIEQIVALCLAIAEGLTFISFAIALLFAFFKRTEPIALAMIDQWLALIVQSIIIALLQALIVGFLVALAASGNEIVAVGVSIVGLVIELLVVKSALSAILKTFDGLFNAFSRATNGAMGSLSSTAGSLLGAGMTVATGGLSGAAMLAGGGSAMQAAGAALGDSQALSGAMRTLSRLPQGRDTDWGEGAAEFLEGAAFRGIGESVGGRVVGAPTGSYLGGRLLSGSEGQKERRSTEREQRTATDTAIPPDFEVVDGEIVIEDSDSSLLPSFARGDSPVGTRLPASPNPGTGLAKRTQRETGLAVNGDKSGDTIDGEVVPNDPAPFPVRPADGFFRPSKPLLMLGTGPELNEVDSGNGTAEVVNEVDTAEERLERSEQNNATTQISDRDLDTAHLASVEESDQSHLEEVTEGVAHDEAIMLRPAFPNGGGQSEQTSLTASLELGMAAAQLAGAAAALTQMSQRADTSQRREDANRQLAQAEGSLEVAGADNVSATLANLVDSLRTTTPAGSGLSTQGLPGFMAIADQLAQVTGMTPTDSAAPLTGAQLTPVGLFTQQALKMGLDGETVQNVVGNMKSAPDGDLPRSTREQLTQRLVDHGYSERGAAAQIDTLASYAQALPETLNVYGTRAVIVASNGTLSDPAAAPPTVTSTTQPSLSSAAIDPSPASSPVVPPFVNSPDLDDLLRELGYEIQ